MPYLNEKVRGDKEQFKLSNVLAFVQQSATASVGQMNKDDASSWELVANFISQVMQEANNLMPAAMEHEHVIKRTPGLPHHQ